MLKGEKMADKKKSNKKTEKQSKKKVEAKASKKSMEKKLGNYKKAGKKESVIIKKGQPFEVATNASEYGYVILLTGATADINEGEFKDNISLKEELEMWKIIAKYNDYMYYFFIQHKADIFRNEAEIISELWKEIERQSKIIKAQELLYKK